MVGRDATDEVSAYVLSHPVFSERYWTEMALDRLHSKEARRRMDSYQIGRVEGRWSNLLPPVLGGKFRRYDATKGVAVPLVGVGLE